MNITAPRSAPTRYSAVTQAFHWVTAILVLLAFVLGPEGSEQQIYSRSEDAGRQLHETLGMAVFILTLLRLLWRSIATRPEPVAVRRTMALAATAVQVALYGLLLALPLTAIAGVWLEGHALTLLWGVQIDAPLSAAHAIGDSLTEVHGLLGDVIIWLAGLHAAAALYHHFLLRDTVLVAMLPRWFPLRK